MRATSTLTMAGLATLLAVPAWAGEVSPLVDTDWLSSKMGNENLVILDIRNRIDGGSAEIFAEGHIPGAVYSNYTEAGWRVERDGIVGMLPPVENLEALIGGLGIDNDDHIVVVPAGVSSSDFGSATRVYWTFKVLGHDAVSILDGGYASWASDPANEIATGPSSPEPTVFKADFQGHLLATQEDVATALATGDALLIDARPEGQFTGAEKAGPVARAGTLRGAVNLQQQLLVDAEQQTAIEPDTLSTLLSELEIPAEGDQVAFCNTGHWASIAWFAASEIGGNKSVSLYDGSMTQWTADAGNEVIKTAP
ncbi:MAG: sulfurtransferase [Pseudomonadota bacterium]